MNKRDVMIVGGRGEVRDGIKALAEISEPMKRMTAKRGKDGNIKN